METENRHEEFIKNLKEQRDQHTLGFHLKAEAQKFADDLLSLLFPHFCKDGQLSSEEISFRFLRLEYDLKLLLSPLLKDLNLHADLIAQKFIIAIPSINKKLWLDAEAINAGDPAAESIDEVILAYPGFTAIAIYRFAHELFQYHVPIFPRLLAEYAHQLTGIDIHPGAQIGTSFAIDHGTGIVIGETTIIGSNVKLYQGVTLGALSVEKSLAKSKRHPTIEDDVVIYAQAVILGGDTVVGHHSIIGGNVWLTKSVVPYSVVYQESRVSIRLNDAVGDGIDFSI
jgi:serine O-acetyltransferase